ncbi:MAG: dioxygenase [Rhodocyclaceae bacterium]|nr:dioxygenase [Rhodocyclaceae bacterium]
MSLPTLFVPHGAPTFALRPGAAGVALVALAQQLDRPRAIIVISPHWETQDPTVGSAANLETIYDFGGFPGELYTLKYPAHSDAALAQRVADCLQAAGYAPRIDPHRGLDHGAWIPLRMMYPAADIPVIPLSIKTHAGAAYHYTLGQALQPLTEEGFLIVGTGSITHNLRDYMACVHKNLPTPDYVTRFANWVGIHVNTQDTAALVDYRNKSPDAAQAQPTDDHFMPFFVALGAAGPNAKGKRFYAGIDDLVIAMDGYQFERAVQ